MFGTGRLTLTELQWQSEMATNEIRHDIIPERAGEAAAEISAGDRGDGDVSSLSATRADRVRVADSNVRGNKDRDRAPIAHCNDVSSRRAVHQKVQRVCGASGGQGTGYGSDGCGVAPQGLS